MMPPPQHVCNRLTRSARRADELCRSGTSGHNSLAAHGLCKHKNITCEFELHEKINVYRNSLYMQAKEYRYFTCTCITWTPWYTTKLVHNGNKVKFNTVDFVKPSTNRQRSTKLNGQFCCRFVAGSTKSTVLNSTLLHVYRA